MLVKSKVRLNCSSMVCMQDLIIILYIKCNKLKFFTKQYLSSMIKKDISREVLYYKVCNEGLTIYTINFIKFNKIYSKNCFIKLKKFHIYK